MSHSQAGQVSNRIRQAGVWLAGGVALAWLTASAALGTVWDGGTDNPFELGAGARALALGGAYPAVADDVTALSWNPAGLARVDRIEVSGMHINLFYDTPYDFFGAAYPLLDWGTFAAGMVRVATGGIIVRDADSTQVNNGDGALDFREYQFGFGREFFNVLSLGTMVKVDDERLLGNEDTGVGLDLGMQIRGNKNWPGGLHWEKMTLGVDAQNVLGPHLELGEQPDVMPLNVRAGVAYVIDLDRWQQKILVALGGDKSTWRDWRANLGLEYRVLDAAALRGGWNSEGWSLGAGLDIFGVALDYALTSQELGLTHRFSLTYRFGQRISQQREEREQQRDREVAERAAVEVKRVREELNAQLANNERRYLQEKQTLLAKQAKVVNSAVAQERQRQALQKNQELELAYFKSLHYFNGIKDYMDKHYRDAVTEFETVAKVDPNYLELPLYLGRSRQLAGGSFMALKPENLKLYYTGIDLYMESKFSEAIVAWQQILASEPNNLMVLRNIEEAQSRVASLNKAQGELAPVSTPAPVPEVIKP
jgi:tetratricopeptide (TPR) repeat protein